MKKEIEQKLLGEIIPGNLPKHIAIIMDGNRRWAQTRNLPRMDGHRRGIKSIREGIKGCIELGIRILTLYAFSTENWQRPKSEISILMQLLYSYLRKEGKKLKEENIRLTTIGDIAGLPKKVQLEINRVSNITSKNDGLILNLALNYGSRQEIIKTIKVLVNSGKEINEKNFSECLGTGHLPDPDLLIRTSGELRMSNFLLWQMAYTELYFTDVFWPDFTRSDLYKAVVDYQQRDRRYGRF